MITRVWGIINMAQALPFYQKGDRWFFNLPGEDGTYICEFWAENEFGNIGYNRAVLFIENGVVKCLRILSTRYRSLFLKLRFGAEAVVQTPSISAEVRGYPSTLEPRRWATKMKVITCPFDMREQ